MYITKNTTRSRSTHWAWIYFRLE